MATKKTWRLQIKERLRSILSILLVFIILAFVLTFEKPAEWLGKLIGVDPEIVRQSAADLVRLSVGALLLIVAITFSSVPFLGVGLAVVGAVFIIGGAISLYNTLKAKKPNNTKLDLGSSLLR